MADGQAICYSFRPFAKICCVPSGTQKSGFASTWRTCGSIQRCKIMRPKCGQSIWLVLLAATFFDAGPARGQIWKQFVPTSRSAAPADSRTTSALDDSRASHESTDSRVPNGTNAGRQQLADASADSYAMTQDSGPWLIVAASFSGNGAE